MKSQNIGSRTACRQQAMENLVNDNRQLLVTFRTMTQYATDYIVKTDDFMDGHMHGE